MPVGNIECPLSASLPRDSNHECRVCRVTVVGLSAYANHISSQLHKDNTDAYDREEEGKEEAEEEYFDQELVQLINQRKEQCRQDETSNTAQEPLTDDRRLQRIREDWMVHGARANYDQSGWRINGAPFRDWKWENESFLNSRKGNFPHSAKNPNSSRYVGGTKGHAVWHSSVSVGPKRHQNLGNSGVAWHANRGSSLTWHHNAPGRNHNWNPGSGVSFPTWHPNNTGGNWKATPRGPNGWNDGFPQVRNRLDDMALSWNTKRGRSMKYNQARYPWQREKEDHISNIIPFGDAAAEQCDTATYSMDFTSDCLPPDSAFDFSVHDKSEHKTTKCSGKGTSPSRDKPHRWSPYPSQKAAENQPATENDVSDTPEKDSSFPPFHLPQKISKDNQANISDTIPKRSVKDGPDCPSENGQLDVDSNNPCTEPVDQACLRKSDQEVNKCNRMPSLKSPLLATPDKKRSLQKRDMSGGQKNIKHLFPSSPRESRTNLSALNLETHRPNSYVSKLRSASSRNANNKNTTETSPKEPVESLSEVLRKAKAILQCSQSMRSQHLTKSYKEQSEEASNSSETGTDLHMDFLENVSDGELSDYENSEDPSLLDGSSPCEMPPSEEIGKEDGKTVEISEKSFRASGMASGSQKYSTVEMESLEVPSHLALSFEPALEREANGESFDASEIRKNNDCDPDLQKGGNQQSLLPELSKLGLPVSLQRDLTRHIGPKSKAGTHLPEPNLNNARRIRNVSGHRKSETDKESGLKPTLRQILNASRRNVNWEQVIQHVTKKKQELGKGLPRFGIEMVPPVQNENEGTDLEEELNLSSFEGFHWEAISMPPPGTARKRSLSESSVVLDRSASVYGFFLDQAADRELEQKRKMSVDQSSWVGQGPNGNEELQTGPKREDADQPKDSPTQKNPESPSPERQHSIISLVTTSPIKSEESPKQILENKKAAKSLQEENSVASTSASVVPTINLVDLATDSSCTSGTEQNDNQSVGKKRRATMDGSPEIPSLERKNKRRKIKGKKERSQVDQLLTISLREEELSRSLQGVDTNLLKARAALQAAYVEVQHLMVLKQQINMEMSAMRTQRIQILQGLQETLEHPEQADKHQENLLVEKSCKLPPAPAPVDPSPTNLFSLFLDPPQFVSSHPSPPGAVLGAPLRVGTPPAFQVPSRVIGSNPDSSLPIKQEPPSSRGGKMDTSLNVSIPPVQGGILQTSGSASQSPSSFPTVTAGLSSLTNGFPSVPEKSAASTSKRGSAETHLFSQSSENAKVEGSNLVLREALLERCTTVEKDPSYPFEQQEQQAESTIASVESKGSKKKKKLRKKKTLRAAHVPDNSDTELDISCNPIRKVKGKKMTKEGKVTTSTSFEQEDGSTALSVERNKDDNDSDSTVEVVEITNPMGEVVDIDSEPGDPKPDSPSKREPLNSTEKRLLEVASSGNDEVSSTSEMGAKYRNGVLRSATETQTTMSSVRSSKNSSEVSSEPGEDEEPTEGIFEGHQAAVNAIQIFGGLLYTCSADKTVRAYNMVNRKCVAIFEGHTSKVNCLLLTLTSGKNSVLYTGSSDHTIRCYNIKSRECTNQFQLDDRVVCLHARWRILYGGLANGNVVTFGIKSGKQLDTFECHGPRAVSCLASAQEGARRLLLVGSYDCTISVRDARNGLLLRTLEGHSKTVLCMKVVNDLVFSGSSDQSVHAHNIHTGELVRIYKGHNHAVTVVNILGKVMVTASLDKFVRVYELQSHDRLQVYGGHTDMIMCMAIHKSMIYTGCYDGSIQAVRLNLLQNYRCWWHGCSLIFGVVDHLKQHLLTDHTNPNFQTLKCRWKNCDAFFTARRGSKQDAPGHIERHAEEDSKMDT